MLAGYYIQMGSMSTNIPVLSDTGKFNSVSFIKGEYCKLANSCDGFIFTMFAIYQFSMKLNPL